MAFRFIDKNKMDRLPTAPGVYAFKSKKALLYIGKAVNIKQRVKNHFQSPVFKDSVFLSKTDKIGYIKTNSEIEALLLEAELIKKLRPKYNSEWKDGKNYFFVEVSREKFPKVFVSHGSDDKIPDFQSNPKPKSQKQKLLTTNYKLQTIHIGPFVDGKALKQTLRILRRVFPFRTCNKIPKKPCLYKELGLCLAPCLDLTKTKEAENVTNWADRPNLLRGEYQKNIKNILQILQGKKRQTLKQLKREMQKASKGQEFEKAGQIRDRVFAIENVFSHSHVLKKAEEGVKLFPPREEFNSFQGLQKILGLKKKIKKVEGYDVSNIQGKSATASMVVFENDVPNKNEYRKFKIKTASEPNDTAMLKEALQRRFQHPEWKMPDAILIDGGIAQLNAARFMIYDLRFKNKIKIMALAKRNNELYIEGRKKPIRLNSLPNSLKFAIMRIRDEAHRFAIAYHKKLRSKNLYS